MVRVNIDSDRISEEQKQARKQNRAITIPGDLFEIVTPHGSFLVKKADYDQYGSVWSFTAEQDIREKFFYPNIDKNSVFFDIGAALGSWTLHALKLGAKAVAFEPDPRECEVLVENVKLNNFENCVLIPAGVSCEEKKGVSFDELEDVEMVTVDEFVKRSGLIPTFMKIDTEGEEANVIRGSILTLAQYKPKLMVEIHNFINPELEPWIKKRLSYLRYKSEDGPDIHSKVKYVYFYSD